MAGPTFLGQSENMLNYMGPQGPIQVAPQGLDPAYAAQLRAQQPMQPMQPQALDLTNPQNNPAVQFMNRQSGVSDSASKLTGQTDAAQPVKPEFVFAGQNKPQPQQQTFDSSKYMKGFETEIGGIAGEAAAKSKGAAQQAKIYGEQAAMVKNYAQQQKEQSEAFFSQYSNETGKLKQMTDDFLKSSNVNPNHLWESSSTGAKIGAGIGVALGAMGAALAGGPNQAMSIIDKTIERDIEAQKLKIEKNKEGLGVQQSMVGQLRMAFDDKRMADAAAYKIAYDEAENRVKQVVASSENPAILARAQQLQGQIQQKRSQYEMMFDQQAKSAAAMSSLGAGQAVDAQSLMRLPKETRDQMVDVGGGKYHMAINDAAAKDLQEKLPAVNSALENIKELKGASNWSVLPTKEKGHLVSLGKTIVTAIKNFEGTGALDQGTLDLMEDLIGDPTAFFQGNFKGKIEALEKSLMIKKENKLKQVLIGYKPLQSEVRSGAIESRPGMSQGGMVNGGQVVAGDSPKNDTVPAMLSAGEIVIPKSLVDASDEELLAFIKKHRK